MKECIIIGPKMGKYLQYSIYPDLRSLMPKGYIAVWNKNKNKAAGCIWLTSKDNRIPYKILPYKKFEEIEHKYLKNGALEISKLIDIPIDYQGVMAVPITYSFYRWDDYDFIGISYALREDGSCPYYRLLIKRKDNTNEA